MIARRTRTGFVCLLIVGATAQVRAGDAGKRTEEKSPRLDWNKPVLCAEGPEGEPVRIQCDRQANGELVCLVAPDHTRAGGPLKRVRGCRGRDRSAYFSLLQQGYRMVPAIAEAPPGWYRDEKGRVFQVTFDLMKRFHLGVGWLPAFDLSAGTADPGRARFDVGFVASWVAPAQRNRHTLHGLEGMVVLEDLEVRALLFGYDLSHASTTPLLRITTFFGKPARHDLYMNLGLGLRLLDLHVHPHRADGVIDLEFADIHAAWDIWQSADLYNLVRLTAGLGAAAMWQTGEPVHGDEASYWLTPKAALEARFGLDRDGFHYLLGDLHWILPVALTGPASGSSRTRAGTSAAYEVIVLAVNDQPLSLRLEAELDYRDDLPPGTTHWDASLLAGMRFSFWAPARLHQDLPRLARN